MAFDRGTGERSLPTRSTVIGCTFAVAGVTAALVFHASLTHLTANPPLFGWTADAYVATAGGSEEWQDLADRLESDGSVVELATVISTTLSMNGEVVPAVIFDPRRGDPLSSLLSGRAPKSGDEVAIGTEVADRYGIGLGDTASLLMVDGRSADFEVVGMAALPNGMEGYREQIAVLGDSTDRFATDDDGPWRAVLVRFDEEVDPRASIESFRAEGYESGTMADRPNAVSNIVDVAMFPLALAVTLTVMMLTLVLYTLAIAARRRSNEFALLRTLGFTSIQLHLVSVTQAMAVTVVSLAVGVPTGLVVGRLAWRLVAEDLGVVVAYRFSVWAAVWFAAIVVGAALIAMLVRRPARQPATGVDPGEDRTANLAR